MSAIVSIVIPTRDGRDTLPSVLDAIAAQDFRGPVELVAIDSGSTDGSRELLRDRVDRLLEVAPNTFNHGATRNAAIAASNGELVVLLVQDAVPASPQWLASLTAPFAGSALLAGTFARQLPRPDASRIARRALAPWVAAGERPRTVAIADAQTYAALSPRAKLELCAFDNVCSCVRRSVWKQIRFPSVTIAEDVAWGREVLLAGFRLAYVPAATVYHSHDRSLRYELERTRLSHRELARLFGLRAIPDARCLLSAVPLATATHLRWLASGDGPRPRMTDLLRAIGLGLVWPLGQYLGGRAAASSHRPAPAREA